MGKAGESIIKGDGGALKGRNMNERRGEGG